MGILRVLFSLLASLAVVLTAFVELRVSASGVLPSGVAGIGLFIPPVLILIRLLAGWSFGRALGFMLAALGVELLLLPVILYHSAGSSSPFLSTLSILLFSYSLAIASCGVLLLIAGVLLLVRKAF